ncbi:hypothetical protein L7F22_029737 [Adiantum nelumboides]|nr:hypothetical protein [Adiantum nelumboides]
MGAKAPALYALALSLAAQLVYSQNASFTFQDFSSTDNLLILGNTTVSEDGSSLFMTYNRSGATGPYFISRVLYSTAILMHNLSQGLAASFSTSFTFSIATNQTDISGDGFTFVIAPNNLLPITRSASAAAMGLFDVDFYKGGNASLLQVVAVEYDTFLNLEYNDPDDHHVGLNINSLTSTIYKSLPPELVLKTTNLSRRLTTWIDYDAVLHRVEVYLAVAPALKASATKILSYSKLSLWDYVKGASYVGFTAGTGLFREKNAIHDWNFTSWLVSVPDRPLSSPSPSPSLLPSSPSGRTRIDIILGTTIGGFFMLFILLLVFAWRKWLSPSGLHLDVDLMVAPRKFTFRDLQMATGDFREKLGQGGSGEVFKGLLTRNNGEVLHLAVKRIVKASKQGEREFKTEVMTIGKLRHKSLVHLYGWCHEAGKLLLVYQFMPNGSIDKLLYASSPSVLSWPLRFSILKGVAAALVYLHVDWEKMIIHRDIKTSNVMLDSEMNARLGDFGLARFFDHDQYCTQASATGVAGTFGYMAPEYAMSGRVTVESDIFSFGILALEIACGRRPFSDMDESLLDFVWRKHEEGNLMDVADDRMRGDFDVDEMRCILHLGLLCAHPDPKSRPFTRRVLQILLGEVELPELPASRPTAIYVQVETKRVYRNGIFTSRPSQSTSDTSSYVKSMDLSAAR